MKLKDIRRKALTYLLLLAIGLFLLNWFYQTEPIVLSIPLVAGSINVVIKQMWTTLFIPWAIFAVRFTYIHVKAMNTDVLYKIIYPVSEAFVGVPDRTIALWACVFGLIPIGFISSQPNFLNMATGNFSEFIGGALFLLCIPWVISHIIGSTVHSRMGFVTFGPLFITPMILVWGFVHLGPIGLIGAGFVGFCISVLFSAMLSTLLLFIEAVYERIAEWPLWLKIKQLFSDLFIKQKPNQTQVTEG